MGKKNLLVLSFFPAFTPPQSGGEERLFRIYEQISAHFHVVLLSSSHFGSTTLRVIHNVDFIEYRVGKDAAYLDCDNAIYELGGDGDRSSVGVALAGQFPSEYHAVYMNLYDDADIIVHESPFTVFYDLMLSLDSKPRVYNSYNAEYILMKTLHGSSEGHYISDYVANCERYLLNVSDLITYCSEIDKIDLEKLVGGPLRQSLMLPNGTSGEYLRYAERQFSSGRLQLVFIGSGHSPNREAVDIIINHLAPALPGFDFHILGNCSVRKRLAKNVYGYGSVTIEEKIELFRRSDIALNPMSSGSGSNVKAIEYMSFGIPIVSTPFGMRGTFAKAGVDYIESSIEEMPEILTILSKDIAKLNTIGRSAFNLSKERLGWSKISTHFAAALNELLSKSATDVNGDAGVRHKKYAICLNDYDPLSSTGGGVTRILGLERGLAQDIPVIILCFWDEQTISMTSGGKNLTIIRIPKETEHIMLQNEYNSKHHVSVSDIVAYTFAPKNKILMGIYKVLRKQAEKIILEHPYMAGVVESFGDAFFYSSQNNETELKTEMLEWHPLKKVLIDSVEKAENYCLRNATATFAVSKSDAKSFSKRFLDRGGPIILVPNGADEAVAPTTADMAMVKSIGRRSVVFLGSGHMPNVEAVWRIRDNYARILPDVEFHIIGSCCAALTDNIPNNMKLWGVVSPGLKSAILNQVSLAINPVASGGGSNVKLSDYFAHGLHVVTTDFGIRGYPSAVKAHTTISKVDEFSDVIRRTLFTQVSNRERIISVFNEKLSIRQQASIYKNEVMRGVNLKRLLFVTYRYTDPTQGGAESMMLEIIKQISQQGDYRVDVIFPDVSYIYDVARFSSNYQSDASLGVPSGLRGVHWRRFPLDPERDFELSSEMGLSRLWQIQPALERAAAKKTECDNTASQRLLLGWHGLERAGHSHLRWSSGQSSLRLLAWSSVRCVGFASYSKQLLITAENWSRSYTVAGKFTIEFEAPAGVLSFQTEANQYLKGDPRIFGVQFSALEINGVCILALPTLWEELSTVEFSDRAKAIYEAAKLTRWRERCELTTVRGPFSSQMSEWLKSNIRCYDALITHNCVFRPAIEAIELAKLSGVPSLFVPHIHLDDDYYHFPDVFQALHDASLSLVSPRAACDFLAEHTGGSIEYFGAGIDPDEFDEAESENDINSFLEFYRTDVPFILVLGRKSGAKRYNVAIDARDDVQQRGYKLNVVMIGPDDDRAALEEDVVYLGHQPRNVVRGALRSALAVVNMSASESFGIVVLEAWLAGTPIVANRCCPAFADLVVHGQNGYLAATSVEVADAICELVADTDLGPKLAESGKIVCQKYTWRSLGDTFLSHLSRIMKS